MTAKSDQAAQVCSLNDDLRRFGRGGRIIITSGIETLGAASLARILAAVADFDAFTADNDPYGEHDCTILEVDRTRVLFKIDYYDPRSHLSIARSERSVENPGHDGDARRRILNLGVGGRH